MTTVNKVDVLLVGSGVMSATLATLLAELAPSFNRMMVERLADVAAESTDAWNNAGTGHAGYCELNYTPENNKGDIEINRALNINASFEDSNPEIEHSTMLLSFLGDQPAHMQMIREDFERWSERLLHDGVPLARAIIIRQAADATWVDRLLDIAPEPAVQKQVYDELMQMTEVNE